MLCATYNIPKRFLKNKGKNLFTYVVGCDNTSCGPHSIFIYEASKIIRNKVASHKLWAMITQVVGHFCDRKLYTSSYCCCCCCWWWWWCCCCVVVVVDSGVGGGGVVVGGVDGGGGVVVVLFLLLWLLLLLFLL